MEDILYNKMKKIAIIGAGGFGREVLMLINQINDKNSEWDFVGFFDDGFEKDTLINNFPIIGNISDLVNWKAEISIAIAIGNPKIKKEIIDKINKNKLIQFPNLIHPSVQINNFDLSIGYGNIICNGCILTINIKIENFVIINLATTVGHDTIIQNYCSIMPGVNISGEVMVCNSVYIGTGAKIINQLEIGEKSIIGAGAVVYKSIPPNCTAIGIPAKPIKFHE